MVNMKSWSVFSEQQYKINLFISPNEYEINKIGQVYTIDKPENYSETLYSMSKIKVKEMYDSGRPKEDSAARFVHTVLEAASQGDERVFSDR